MKIHTHALSRILNNPFGWFCAEKVTNFKERSFSIIGVFAGCSKKIL